MTFTKAKSRNLWNIKPLSLAKMVQTSTKVTTTVAAPEALEDQASQTQELGAQGEMAVEATLVIDNQVARAGRPVLLTH